jgi:hypothetical protein
LAASGANSSQASRDDRSQRFGRRDLGHAVFEPITQPHERRLVLGVDHAHLGRGSVLRGPGAFGIGLFEGHPRHDAMRCDRALPKRLRLAPAVQQHEQYERAAETEREPHDVFDA